ncbi:MAG: DNA gyrase inhibitor YacG [Planctomycetes bacterium]|nr:DNA gyrase inhibitor YacG [Planctomycetota bacterium]MBI3834194.1 DNA gyrase inhibitor YacG [Planctomycetota bacterium]
MPTYECPTCKKTHAVARREDAPFRPFCSERCKMVDLGRWLDGTYSISEPISPGDQNAPESQSSSEPE